MKAIDSAASHEPASTTETASAARAPRLLLIGNPNVGKSVIFGFLTGKYVTVSNYPGTTVEVSRGQMRYGGKNWEVIDTPGINSLVPHSDDERVTRDLIISQPPDLIVQVADAKNLRRTLLITSQLAEFGIPMLLVLNLVDEARNRNIVIDAQGISELFGIPVIQTVAIDGEGLDDLHKSLGRARIPSDPLASSKAESITPDALTNTPLANGPAGLPLSLSIEWLQSRDPEYRSAVESRLHQSPNPVSDLDSRLKLRKLANHIDQIRHDFLENSVSTYKSVESTVKEDAANSRPLQLALIALSIGLSYFLYTEAARLFNAIFRTGLPTPYDLVNNWLNQNLLPPLAKSLGPVANILIGQFNDQSGAFENGLLYPLIPQLLLLVAPVMLPLAFVILKSRNFAERLGRWTREWKTGLPLLIVVLLLMYEFVGVIGAGTLVDFLENTFFNAYLTPALQHLVPGGFIYDFIVGKYGLVSVGLTYSLAIVFPIVTTFFIAFGILEDSGYLPRLAVLSDRVFRFMGLNGKAVLPMVLGLGCDTMATMTTRILSTKKERIIATLLLALGVPCSAQLGVILGISASMHPGVGFTVFAVVLSQMMLVGFLSSKLIKGERPDFIYEIPPIRIPQMRNVLTKTRLRLKWYAKEALPLFLLGTLILFILDRLIIPLPGGGRSGLAVIEAALAPIVRGVLDLPEQTAQVLLLGFLRRDYGAAGLNQMVRDHVLNAVQITTALVTLTLFIPCVANFFMMIREHGVRKAMIMLAFITPFAIAVGGAVNWLLKAAGIHF